MSLSSSLCFSLDLPQTPIDVQNSESGSSGREKRGSSVLRCRGGSNQTPRDAQAVNDVVHVALRIKPFAPEADSSTIMPFSIEPGTFGTPSTGRQRAGNVQCVVADSVTAAASGMQGCSGGGEQEEVFSESKNSCHAVSSLSLSSTVLAPQYVQNGAPQLVVSPRSGMSTGGKILTLSFPTADGTKKAKYMYEFADVIGPTVTDQEICESMIPPIIEQLKAGFNACVLCYGQTGSGKTHTINTLAPVLTNELFSSLDKENDIVEVSYIQIHNNSAYNLLGESKSEHGILLQKPRGTMVSEPRYLVRNATELNSRIAGAQKKRFVSSHALNMRSSRSHVLLSLHVTKCVGGIPVTTSRLTLADLAGSERMKKTGVAGEERDEAIAINKSLSVLHAVMRATVDDATVLPLRESILTLYLASSLTESYILLIATVSMEKQNYAETKSSLDFATTAKRCVVTKKRGQPRDFILNGVYSFDETCSHLISEIETLRLRVATLQEEVNIEKQHSALLMHNACNNTTFLKDDKKTDLDSSCEVAKVRDHVLALERQCTIFQNLLRDREQELSALRSHGELAEKLNEQLHQQVEEKEEAQRFLEEAAPQLETSELLSKVSSTFFWMQERLDSAYQQRGFLERTMEGMQAEQHRMMVELLEFRRRVLQLEETKEGLEGKLEKVIAENVELASRVEELNLKLLREFAERAIREETMAWLNESGKRNEECERLSFAFEDQRMLCDVLQGRLTSTEQELDRINKLHGTLLQDLRKKDEAFCSIWLLLTPQQKACFMSYGTNCGDYDATSSSASLHQGHENVQLRSQVRALKRQLEQEMLHRKEFEYRIEDLLNENSLLQKRLRNREEEYKALVALDEDYRDEREKMEQQLAHLYTYIEEHNAKEHVFEKQLREAQAEWQRLDEEYRNAQREVVELTTKLEKAVEEIKVQEADKDKLKSKLREANRHSVDLIAHQRQLITRQRSSDDVYRRLGHADKTRQYAASEVNLYNYHTDLVKKKVMHRNSDVLRKAPVHSVDPTQIVRGTTAALSASLTNRIKRFRNDMTQHLSPCGLLQLSTELVTKGSRNASGSSHDNHNSVFKRKTALHVNLRNTTQKSGLMRSNTSLLTAPSYITDRARRRSS